jgi:alkanesulfonate monooxygenase SsuD/methylene tetrahydromethanopterin reductase-like flavin-dependent oxidoreductase (luciferase family)
MINRIGKERGWQPVTRAQFEREIEVGSLYVGSPGTVARKIAATAQALGGSISRFDMKYSAGPLAHPLLMQSIQLYGREVIPRVRELMTSSSSELPVRGDSERLREPALASASVTG